MDNQPKRYIVESVTKAGARFRPSDWIDRISSWDATFAQHRLVYSQRLHPILLDGKKMLVIEPELETANRQMFDAVMQFIERNDLRVYVQFADGHLEEFTGDNAPVAAGEDDTTT
jgi:hypothetical protein